jgi:hypothetical protein
MKSQNTETYKEFITKVELVNIANVLGRYRRVGDCTDLKNTKEFGIETARASFNPPYIISGENLVVPAGYRVEVKVQNKLIAEFEYHYEVCFKVIDADVVTKALGDNDITEFFVGYQMDKLIWSNLRCNLSEACSRMGITRIVLPLLR